MSWDAPEPEYYLEMQVRGIEAPVEAFKLMKSRMNARIFDSFNGKFIEDEEAAGFEKWKDFTEEVIKSLNYVTVN